MLERGVRDALLGGIALTWAACALAQEPSAPRIAPLPESDWTAEVRTVATAFEPVGMPNLAATDELWADNRIADGTWATLAASQSTEQMIDVLVSVGGYRSTSMLIDSAGVQLDANMADFRFPSALR